MNGNGMMIRVGCADISCYLGPARRSQICQFPVENDPGKFLSYLFRGIKNLSTNYPKYWIRCIASDDVSPMLFHFGDAHLAQGLMPRSYNGRSDSRVHQQLYSAVRGIEILRIDLFEVRIPDGSAFVAKARID